MKSIAKSLALIAAAAMGLTACQNDFEEQIEAKNSVIVNFVADEDATRTSVDTTGDAPVFAWGEQESFAVLEQTATLAEATAVTYAKVDGKANITAEFAANEGAQEYRYATIHPASGYVSAESLEAATLALPAEQTMDNGSYDPKADLMVSKVVTTAAQPTETQLLQFTRVAAVVKMNIKNFGVELGDQLESVSFVAEGKTLAGTVSTNLTNPEEFTVVSGSNSVKVATTSASEILFTTLPATLEAGTPYTIIITTNKKLYIKKSTIAEGKSLEFVAGKVTRVGVDMQGVVASDKWVLVRDASTLKQGDVVAIASYGTNYVLGADMATNYPYASDTEATKVGDYLYHPISSDPEKMIQPFTIAQRDAARTAFDFYNGTTDYEGDEDSGFLWAPDSGSKYLKLQGYYSANTQFDVTIDEQGVATVIATNGSGSSKQMMYNSSTYASSRYFHCYSEISEAKYISIYRLEGAVGTIPTIPANIEVPEADEPVEIAEEGTTTATTIEEVVFNYVGDWDITVSASEAWLTVGYADGALTYTAEANTGSVREAVVTITATKGEESLTWSFTVSQKGAPAEITIAEFITKGKDLTAVYKLTGKLTEIPSSTSGSFKLTDESGNIAKINYLKTDDGSYVKGNIDVKVGDIMTVTTVVTGTTKGSGGNSTYPSIYKGHYTMSATASDAVAFGGGDATISVKVEKFGHITAPTTIVSGEVAEDNNPVAAYSFTDNGDGTATAVVTFGENTTGSARKVTLSFSTGSAHLDVATSVTVMQDVNPALKKGWYLVTDVNDLKAGDKIIIAATGLDYAISTATNTNNRKSTAITKEGTALVDVSDSVQQYDLEIDDKGLYAFKGTLGTDAGKYIYASSSSSNYMKVSTTLDDNGKWTIDIAADGAATIVAQGSYTRNHMQYNNKATSSPAFYCTDGSFGAVCLYKFYE